MVFSRVRCIISIELEVFVSSTCYLDLEYWGGHSDSEEIFLAQNLGTV